ncbi:MAG: 30S ribosomal protein S17 [Candidatus Dojkabacteria bacterium]|nr:MAG: 30S ribosomal protein S17 [Candidatus Dojkabacteria bacterium]
MDKANKKKNRKRLEGVVLSNKMQGTVKVRVEKPVQHAQYYKIVSYRKAFFASTTKEIEVGARVVIEETRPVAKNVNWKVVQVLEA